MSREKVLKHYLQTELYEIAVTGTLAMGDGTVDFAATVRNWMGLDNDDKANLIWGQWIQVF